MKIPVKVSLLITMIVILFLAIFIYSFSGDTENGEDTQGQNNIDYGQLDEVVFDVKTAPIIKGDLVLNVSANGIVKAWQEIDVTSNISGRIDEINVYEGKKVNANDTLIRIDDRDYQITLTEADNRLLQARSEYSTQIDKSPLREVDKQNSEKIMAEIAALDNMLKRKEISEDKYLAKKEELEISLLLTGAKRKEVILSRSGYYTAMTNRMRALLNLEYCNITAPFSGVIGNFELDEGEIISSGKKLFKLMDISKLKIDVGVLENDIPQIQLGKNASILMQAMPNETFEGRVVFISPYVDTDTKTCKVTIELKNPGQKIKPGMYAQVKIESRRLKDRILVPKEALLVRDNRTLIFMVEADSIAKWNYVDVGEQNDKYVEILGYTNQPVTVDDKVIVEGQFTLAHDARINIIN